MNVRLLAVAIGALLLAGAGVPRAGAAEPAAYSFAAIPQGPPEQVRAVWLPIVERLSADSGVPLRLRVYSKVEDFQAALASGAVDFAFANPVQVIRAFERARYRPLVRDERPIRGVLFVAADSPITSADRLAEQEVAFVGLWAVCSVSLRARTRPLHVRPKFVGTAANAYKNVLLGIVAAGGLLDTTLAEAPPEVRARLRVVYETPPMVSHALIVHPRVRRVAARRVAAAALALRGAEGASLLRPVHLDAPVEASYARDYAPLEALLAAERQRPARRSRP